MSARKPVESRRAFRVAALALAVAMVARDALIAKARRWTR